MLAIDLTINASTAIPVGTNAARTLSLGNPQGGTSLRSDATVALTAPEVLAISHSRRTQKLKSTISNDLIPVSTTRHVVRLSKHRPATNVLDPDYKSNLTVSLLIEVPEGPGITVTSTQVSDAIKSLVSMLCSSADANLIRVLSNEP